MKFRFCTKLLVITLVIIVLSNVILLTTVRGRDNTTYIMGSSHYFGSATTYILEHLPFWYRGLGYNVISQDNPTVTQFWESLYADVQILDGHGDWDRFWSKNVGIVIGDGRSIDGTHYFGTNDIHWKYDTDLVVYCACKTAVRSSIF